MARIKLFSESAPIVRRKLFSDEPEQTGNEQTTLMECSDCGFVLETAATTTDLVCPKCGGRRFNVARVFFSPNETTPEPIEEAEEIEEKEEETKEEAAPRVGLFSVLPGEETAFQKTFSETEDEFELKLKEFSGQTFAEDEVEKTFGVSAEDLYEKGFAEKTEEGVHVLDTAFLQSRLFSKILVKVTKVFELDPKIVGAALNDKSGIIEGLEDKISPRGVIVLKKSHGFDVANTEDTWAKDSGIVNDLPLEFGGQDKPVSEFKEIINTRYPDAPEDIMEYLKNKGIISMSGDKVSVLK